MRGDGIGPNVVTYNTVFSKDLSEVSADQMIDWYKNEGCGSEEPLQAAIGSYRRDKRIGEALRICIEWPYLGAARRIMRGYGEETLRYFEKQLEDISLAWNATFALGIAYLEWGEQDIAVGYLEDALAKAGSDDSKAIVRRWLERAKG